MAGQRATESQKQLLSPEHSSCTWISFPALLPEQRPGPDKVVSYPQKHYWAILISISQVHPQTDGGRQRRRKELGLTALSGIPGEF